MNRKPISKEIPANLFFSLCGANENILRLYFNNIIIKAKYENEKETNKEEKYLFVKVFVAVADDSFAWLHNIENKKVLEELTKEGVIILKQSKVMDIIAEKWREKINAEIAGIEQNLANDDLLRYPTLVASFIEQKKQKIEELEKIGIRKYCVQKFANCGFFASNADLIKTYILNGFSNPSSLTIFCDPTVSFDAPCSESLCDLPINVIGDILLLTKKDNSFIYAPVKISDTITSSSVITCNQALSSMANNEVIPNYNLSVDIFAEAAYGESWQSQARIDSLDNLLSFLVKTEVKVKKDNNYESMPLIDAFGDKSITEIFLPAETLTDIQVKMLVDLGLSCEKMHSLLINIDVQFGFKEKMIPFSLPINRASLMKNNTGNIHLNKAKAYAIPANFFGISGKGVSSSANLFDKRFKTYTTVELPLKSELDSNNKLQITIDDSRMWRTNSSLEKLERSFITRKSSPNL